MVEKMLQLNPHEVDTLLSNGHGWAVDHISTSADDVGEVGTWLCNELGQPSNNMMNEANNENNNWETVYTWAKLFSTDNGNFLSKNNITSGVWLKKAIESGKITPQDIDNVTRESDGTKFSELPMLKSLTKNTIPEYKSAVSESNSRNDIANYISILSNRLIVAKQEGDQKMIDTLTKWIADLKNELNSLKKIN
jgi:hypothetical protein